MSNFPRQKRQARSYWAELGFLALGLFALQPSLLSNLLSGSQSNSSFELGSRTMAPQNPLAQNSQNWRVNSFDPNYAPPYQYAPMSGHQNVPSQYIVGLQNPMNSVSPNNSSGQYYPAYTTGQVNGQTQQLSPYYGFQQPQALQSSNGYAYGYQPEYPNARSSGNTPSNGWPSQTAANYSSNWKNTSSNVHTGNASNRFSSLIVKPSQSSLFGNGNGNTNYGADNYLSGRTNSAYYPYPTNSTGSNGFTPYRPGNSFYR